MKNFLPIVLPSHMKIGNKKKETHYKEDHLYLTYWKFFNFPFENDWEILPTGHSYVSSLQITSQLLVAKHVIKKYWMSCKEEKENQTTLPLTLKCITSLKLITFFVKSFVVKIEIVKVYYLISNYIRNWHRSQVFKTNWNYTPFNFGMPWTNINSSISN